VATSGRGEDASVSLTDDALRISGVAAFTAVDQAVALELAFASPGPVVGRLEERDGAPVPGVEVTLTCLDVRLEQYTATSQADGSFEVPPVRPGRYGIYIVDPQYLLTVLPKFVVAADRATPEVRVVATRGGAARVTVIGPDGAPREHPVVHLQRVGGTRRIVGPASEDSPWPGAYAPLEPGQYVAVARAGRSIPSIALNSDLFSDFAASPWPDTPELISTAGFEAVAGEVTEVVIHEREAPLAVISGRVECGGEAADGETVWLVRDDAMLSMARSDREGRFEIPVAFTGHAVLFVDGVRARAAARLEVDVIDGPNPVGTIALPTGTVVGRLPADLQLEEGARALPAAFTPGEDEPSRYSSGASGGRFVITHLPDGDHVIGLPVEGGGVAHGVRVTIEDGSAVHGVTIGANDD